MVHGLHYLIASIPCNISHILNFVYCRPNNRVLCLLVGKVFLTCRDFLFSCDGFHCCWFQLINIIVAVLFVNWNKESQWRKGRKSHMRPSEGPTSRNKMDSSTWIGWPCNWHFDDHSEKMHDQKSSMQHLQVHRWIALSMATNLKSHLWATTIQIFLFWHWKG